jgi:tRNA A37 threonylcarbamoyladenosine dehydratase
MSIDKSWMSRTCLMVGDAGLEKLINSHVLIVGLGGVGSYAAEAIARAGVGEMTIIDGDVVDPTNRNRQLPALATNHGQSKAALMEQRIKEIHPEIKLNVRQQFMRPDAMREMIAEKKFSYAIDAIDSVTPKLNMIVSCLKSGTPIISSMGAGAKMDPTKIIVTDISKTHTCPFAQYVRKRLRKLGVYKGLDVVISTEFPYKKSVMLTDGSNFKKSAYGTISYLPAAFGLACASVVIRKLVDWVEVDPYLDSIKKNK